MQRILYVSWLSMLFFGQLHAFERMATLQATEAKGAYFGDVTQVSLFLDEPAAMMILEYLDTIVEFTIEPNNIVYEDHGLVTYTCQKDGISLRLMDYGNCRGQERLQSIWVVTVQHGEEENENDSNANFMRLQGNPYS